MKKDWEVKKLGEVCKTSAGGTPLKVHKDYYEGGTIPWLLSGEVAQGEITQAQNFITEKGLKNSSAKLFPRNTVLVAMYGATAGQVGVLRFPAATNQAVCGILPNDKTVPEFIFYYFLSIKDELVAQAVGGAQPNISQLKIKDTKFPIPSLSEQQRIIAILDEAFAAIDRVKANAEKNLKNARALFESYLQSVFANPGEGWEEKSLGAEIDLLCGFAFKSSRYTESPDDVRLLRGDNIMQGKLRWEDVKRWPCSEVGEYSRYQLAKNDIVLAMDRPWVKAGLKYSSISKEDLPCLLVQRTARLRVNATLDKRFLTFLLGGRDFTHHIVGVQSGIGVPHISAQQIKDFKFLCPPISEQQTIVVKLDALSAETKKLEAIYGQKLIDLDELKKSVLQKAFRGELSGTKGG